jgi:hypothetical protein
MIWPTRIFPRFPKSQGYSHACRRSSLLRRRSLGLSCNLPPPRTSAERLGLRGGGRLRDERKERMGRRLPAVRGCRALTVVTRIFARLPILRQFSRACHRLLFSRACHQVLISSAHFLWDWQMPLYFTLVFGLRQS